MFSQCFTNNIKCELKNIFTSNKLKAVVIALPDNSANQQPYFNAYVHDLTTEECIYLIELLKSRVFLDCSMNKYL